MRVKLFYLTIFLSILKFSLSANETLKPQSIQNKNEHIEEYLRLIQTFEDHLGPAGDHTKGEIQIVLEPNEIREIEESYKQRLMRRGVDEKTAISWSRVGIIDSDSIWIWIRDAVILPSGRKTIRDRMSWKTAVDGPQGVSVLPVLPDKRMVVCLRYKHATRSWQLELPRGIRLFGETAEKASDRQLHIKTGFTAKSQLYLGSIAPDSSSFNTLSPVFLGYIDENIEPAKQIDNNITGLLLLTKEEIKAGFLKGYMELKIHGETKKVSVNDSFLSYAILQAEIRNLI